MWIFCQQGAKITYEREANLIIDYSSLGGSLKQVCLVQHAIYQLLVSLDHCSNCFFTDQLEDPSEIRNTMNELANKVNKLQATLQRIQAPNMKALEK